ncbi:hypothetical protein V8G54_029887 [Vigna mungo]|uniref:Uncharacterized protein n=1 Tax=Vigna mungo TaxID=3915 RepID=A0AAQ3RKR7_VIGMU
MEMEPWEALGVDESDLSAFLRPCNTQSSSSALIPGPVGAVQAVVSNRCRDDPLHTQEFIRRVGLESRYNFSTNPWLCAIQFVRSQGMVDTDDVAHKAQGIAVGSVVVLHEKQGVTKKEPASASISESLLKIISHDFPASLQALLLRSHVNKRVISSDAEAQTTDHKYAASHHHLLCRRRIQQHHH